MIINIVKKILLVVIVLCPFVVFAKSLPRPNIIMIVIDDLGWSDVGYNLHGNAFETPHIDKLASSSLVFTNAYAGASNCAPSRAVLMSGQYTPRHGVYTVSPANRGNEKTRKLMAAENRNTLRDTNVTLAETLKAAGYTTGHFGKWHLGDDPKTQGFDHNVAGYNKGHPKTYFSPYNIPFLEDGPKGEYLPDRITTEAITWIESVKDKTFFAYIPYYTVHTPLQAVTAIKQKYLIKPGIANEKQATYAAMVESMDTNIGRILQAIKRNKLAQNTLVIFTSDNGGIRAIAAQDPLRAGKGSYYEGGIRVPLIVSWPGKIQADIEDTPVINADFYPTLINITKAKKPRQTLDGMDLTELMLYRKSLADRTLYWHFPIYLEAYNARVDQGKDPLFRTRPGSALRKGKWKLIHYFEDKSYELYDLESDLGEHINFAKYYPNVMRELKGDLHRWWKITSAPIPTKPNPKYDADFEYTFAQKKLMRKK